MAGAADRDVRHYRPHLRAHGTPGQGAAAAPAGGRHRPPRPGARRRPAGVEPQPPGRAAPRDGAAGAGRAVAARGPRHAPPGAGAASRRRRDHAGRCRGRWSIRGERRGRAAGPPGARHPQGGVRGKPPRDGDQQERPRTDPAAARRPRWCQVLLRENLATALHVLGPHHPTPGRRWRTWPTC